MTADISPDFRPSKQDSDVFRRCVALEGSPEAITTFARHAWKLTDYGYWFGLSTFWVNYTGWSDLALWKRLFSSTRPNRATSLMKPSELEALRDLPDPLTAYRAHRPGETDWIAYTLDEQKAAIFASARGVLVFKEYQVAKADVLALFLRRGESEVLVLDKEQPGFVRDWTVSVVPDAEFQAIKAAHP